MRANTRAKDDRVANLQLSSAHSYSVMLHNEGSRSLTVIGEVTGDVRLLPGDELKIDAAAPVRITVYDGGVQLEYDAPRMPARVIHQHFA